MEDISDLIKSLTGLISVVFIGLYGFIFWLLHNFRAEIPEFFNSITVNKFLVPIASNNISFALTLGIGYILAVFYISGGDNNKSEYPRSQILVELANNIQFVMPAYFAALLLAIYPSGGIAKTLLTATMGFILYLVFRKMAEIFSTGSILSKMFTGLVFTILSYYGFSAGSLSAEIAIMGLVVGYVYIIEYSCKKYHELITQDYSFLAKNHLRNNEAKLVFDDLDHVGRVMSERLYHHLIPKLSDFELLRGGNFGIFLGFATISFILDLSILTLIFILATYPLTVNRLNLLDYSPRRPVNIKGADYEAVFITEENDREDYYVLLTPDGEIKLRADSISGYEVYSGGEGKEKLQKILENKDN